jgi:hypothetical protein
MSEEEDKLEVMVSNFLFAIFLSNPTKDSVRVTIDDGSIRFVMKREKFADLIGKLCSPKIKNQVEMVMKEYGETYLLDRQQGKLTHLTPSQIKELDFKKIREETIKREQENTLGNMQQFTYSGGIRDAYENMLNMFKPQAKMQKKEIR